MSDKLKEMMEIVNRKVGGPEDLVGLSIPEGVEGHEPTKEELVAREAAKTAKMAAKEERKALEASERERLAREHALAMRQRAPHTKALSDLLQVCREQGCKGKPGKDGFCQEHWRSPLDFSDIRDMDRVKLVKAKEFRDQQFPCGTEGCSNALAMQGAKFCHLCYRQTKGEKKVCPTKGCGRPIKSEWDICPACHHTQHHCAVVDCERTTGMFWGKGKPRVDNKGLRRKPDGEFNLCETHTQAQKDKTLDTTWIDPSRLCTWVDCKRAPMLRGQEMCGDHFKTVSTLKHWWGTEVSPEDQKEINNYWSPTYEMVDLTLEDNLQAAKLYNPEKAKGKGKKHDAAWMARRQEQDPFYGQPKATKGKKQK